MTGKLIKYEMRSGIRAIGILWAILLGMAVIFGIVRPVLDSWIDSSGVLKALLQIVPGFVYFGVLVATIVLTMLLVIQRFYRGLLGDEGYLLHTFPVKTRQLIISKAFSSTVVMIISGIIAMLSILCLLGTHNLSAFLKGLSEIFRQAKEYPMVYLIAAEALVLGIAGLVSDVYHAYAAMAIGQLSGKHRALASVGAYLGIGAIMTTVTITLGNWGVDSGFITQFSRLADIHEGLDAMKGALLVLIALCAVKALVLHAVTEVILTKKLNLL